MACPQSGQVLWVDNTQDLPCTHLISNGLASITAIIVAVSARSHSLRLQWSLTAGATQVRAGVEARVKAAMSHGSQVQAELDGIKAVHESKLCALRSQITELQEHSGQQQQQLDTTLCQLSNFQDAAARCGKALS